MNFDLSDDQATIKRTARDVLAARYPPALRRELAGSERGFTDDQWSAITELGWSGVVVDEAYGGLGFGALELTVIAEELGYALAPTPLLPSIWAALLLQAAGSEEQRDRWLSALASGEARGTVAVWDASPNEGAVVVDGRLTAHKIAVPDAATADVIIVAGTAGDHLLVDATAEGITVTAQAALDPTRKLAEVRFDDVAVQSLHGHDAADRLALAYATIVTSLAAESVGVAQRAMEMAVEYAKDRRQFDRPIGSNQAIAHRCSQMLLETEGARSLTYGAAYAIDHAPETAPRAASMAKAYAGDAGFRVCASALQVHGGIGFTWEHDLHFFLKRGTANAHAFGDSAWHRERVVELAGLVPSVENPLHGAVECPIG